MITNSHLSPSDNMLLRDALCNIEDEIVRAHCILKKDPHDPDLDGLRSEIENAIALASNNQVNVRLELVDTR